MAGKVATLRPSLQFDSDVVTHLSKTPLRPVVFTGEKIVGRLHVESGETGEPLFDTAQVTFNGQVKSTIRHGDKTRSWTEKPLVRMSSVTPWDDFHHVKNTTSQCSFFFDIPHTITLPTVTTDWKSDLLDVTELSDNQALPPSMHISRSPVPPPNAPIPRTPHQEVGDICTVTYSICAQLFLDGKSVGVTTREIIVFPTSEVPPPLDLQGSGSEYTLADSSVLRHFWQRGKDTAPKLEVSMCEPSPFHIHPPEFAKTSSTQLRLQFKLRQGTTGEPSFFKAPDLKTCRATIALEAMTYFSTREQKTILSLAEIRKSPLVLATRATVTKEVREVVLGDWEWDGKAWGTTATVEVVAPDRLHSLPSFFSKLVARRFMFAVGLDVRGGAKMALKVPVQVVLAKGAMGRMVEEANRATIDGPETVGEEWMRRFEEPPIYVA